MINKTKRPAAAGRVQQLCNSNGIEEGFRAPHYIQITAWLEQGIRDGSHIRHGGQL